MASYSEGPSFKVSAALGRDLRVILSSGKLALAGAGADDLGTTARETFAVDDVCAVIPRNRTGTTKMVASGAISEMADVYGAASGKISATISGDKIGVAVTASAADGDVIDVMRNG